MPKSSVKKAITSCSCDRTCGCQRVLRCRCRDSTALLALALWDYGRAIRRRRTTSN